MKMAGLKLGVLNVLNLNDISMKREPKLKVLFSKTGEEKARALVDEQIKAIDYFSTMYVRAMNEIYIMNDLEKQPKPSETL